MKYSEELKSLVKEMTGDEIEHLSPVLFRHKVENLLDAAKLQVELTEELGPSIPARENALYQRNKAQTIYTLFMDEYNTMNVTN